MNRYEMGNVVKSERPNSDDGLTIEHKSVHTDHLNEIKYENDINASRMANENTVKNTKESNVHLGIRINDDAEIVSNFNISGNFEQEYSDKYDISLASSVKNFSNLYVQKVFDEMVNKVMELESDHSKKLEMTESSVHNSQKLEKSQIELDHSGPKSEARSEHNSGAKIESGSEGKDNVSENEFKRTVIYGNLSDSESADVEEFNANEDAGDKVLAEA